MARKTVAPEMRKQPVSVSLTGSEIVMLDNLAKAGKTNRSALLAALITGKAFKDLGLSALETHAASVQKWMFGGTSGACNPHATGGRCTHPTCVKIYKEMGL